MVLGQPDFTTGIYHPGSNATAGTFTYPKGVAKDASGNLYVVSSWDCRVLQFRPPFTNGKSASMVFGQPALAPVTQGCTFTAVTPATPTNMGFPSSAAVDSFGNLWVTDTENSRVLEYRHPFRMGMATALVLGQHTATAAAVDIVNYGCNHDYSSLSYYSSPSSSTLCSPDGIVFDSRGNHRVADRDNNRVLEYRPPFSTGMAASLELGQPAATASDSVTANNGGISATSLDGPDWVGIGFQWAPVGFGCE